MHPLTLELRHGKVLSPRAVMAWRVVQVAVWLLGAALFFTMVFSPDTGAMLFWNVLIPVAPLLFVLALGVWRNVCPLGAVNLLPRHLGLSKRKKLTQRQAGVFSLASVVAFYLIVPLRHLVFNHDGHATALLLLALVAVGMGLGFVYEWKSAWCSGLCPIHPVEKLYGGHALVTVPNTHCRACMNCVVPCPDSTPGMHPLLARNSSFHTIGGLLIVGGLPGFIWGWFNVPDMFGIDSMHDLAQAYILPMAGLVLSLAVYLLLMGTLGKRQERFLVNLFAAAGVSCYYWYRLPALIGFGQFVDDGMLFDLRGNIAGWSIPLIRTIVVTFFFYWFMIRPSGLKSWTMRPAFARK